MERPTTMRAIPGRQGESTPSPYFPFSQKLPAAVLDASFSSYIQPPPNNPIDDSAEISIFDATKYFNSEAENPKLGNRVSPVVGNGNSSSTVVSELPRFSSASSSVDGYGYGNRNYRTGSFHATPTASSEASWNSQTGLLSNPPGALAVSVRHPPASVSGDQKRKGSAKKWILRRRCPCSGKKSVQVEEKMSEPRTPTSSHLAPNSRVMVTATVKRQGNDNRNHNNNNLHISNSFPGRVEKSDCSSVASSADWMERREVGIPNSVRRISAETTRFGSHHRVVLPPNSAEGNSINGGGGGFAFPILSQSTAAAAPPVKLVLKPKLSILEDPPRESLEVFRPAEEVIVGGNPAVKLALEPPKRKSFTFPASPRSRITAATDDDMASDASSDLFEIESFSTQTTSYQLNGGSGSNRRDSMEDASTFNARRLSGIGGGGGGAYRDRAGEEDEDEEVAPSIAATECYEPSEASIAWSVVTAEGFDRASVTNYSVTASEADEVRFMMMRQVESSETARNGGAGGGKKRGGLLSCRCEKAVSVGPQPMRSGGGGGGEGHRGVSMTAGHVNGRATATAAATSLNISHKKPPLARSHSARLSLPFPA